MGVTAGTGKVAPVQLGVGTGGVRDGTEAGSGVRWLWWVGGVGVRVDGGVGGGG